MWLKLWILRRKCIYFVMFAMNTSIRIYFQFQSNEFSYRILKDKDFMTSIEVISQAVDSCISIHLTIMNPIHNGALD